MIMNPVVALLLASSSTSAQVSWGADPTNVPTGYTVITTLKDAVQSNAVSPDPAAAANCDVDQANRVLSNA